MKHIILTLLLLLCGLAARAENVVSVSSASGHPQDEVTLNVSLTTTDAAVAFQAEIPLDGQLTYVTGSATLDAAHVTDHQMTAAVVDGTLKIFVYSLSLSSFVGNEGTLLSFTLRLKNEPGNYTLNMGNAKLSDASGTALTVTTQNGTVTILSPKLQINTPSLNYGHVPIRSEYTQTARVSNVGNEPLTITAITFSDAVFGCPSFTETTLQPNGSANFTFKFAPMVKGAVTATATIVSNSISGNGIINLVADPYAVNEIHVGNTTGYCDSIVELPISMNNMEDIIGLQIEASLNTALEFVDFTLSDRKTDHVATGIVSGTTLRLMAYSPSGAAFTGDDGVIGTVRFLLKGMYGNYYLNPTKAVLADSNGEDVLSAKYQGRVTIRSPRINGNSSLSFGSTPVTETVTKEYVVSNNGNASMRIDQVIFDQPDFSVSETFPITVNQNSNATLHVSYSREQAGNFNALMKIYSNDPQNGLKNIALSGHRYEPNSLGLSTDSFCLEDGDVAVAISMDNYSAIVALQADFCYPHEDYSVSSSDFQLTNRFASHNLYAMSLNDSTYRILVLSMQNAEVTGHDGVALNVTLHPVATPSEEEYTVSVFNIVLSEAEGLNVFTGEDVEASFALSVTQAAQLSQGWNWWSTYIEQDDMDGLTMLEESLGSNGEMIKSQSATAENYYSILGYNYWFGDLSSLSNEEGYTIKVNGTCDAQLRGKKARPENHPITIHPDWNWIGYPLSESQAVETALEGFGANQDDLVKSQGETSTYYEGYGWFPSINLTPNQGYKYYSNSNVNKTLTYQFGRNEVVLPEEKHNFWTNDIHAFEDNFTVIAKVLVGEESVKSADFELGAFVGNECRGSARLAYFAPLDCYFAVLTVVGEEGESVRFGFVNNNNGMVNFNCNCRLSFKKDAIWGNLDNPYLIKFGDEETQTINLSLYPNPVDSNVPFTIVVPQDVTISELFISNMLGTVVRHETGYSKGEVKSLPTTGVYDVQLITTSGKTYHGRIIVK